MSWNSWRRWRILIGWWKTRLCFPLVNCSRSRPLPTPQPPAPAASALSRPGRTVARTGSSASAGRGGLGLMKGCFLRESRADPDESSLCSTHKTCVRSTQKHCGYKHIVQSHSLGGVHVSSSFLCVGCVIDRALGSWPRRCGRSQGSEALRQPLSSPTDWQTAPSGTRACGSTFRQSRQGSKVSAAEG